MPAFIVIVASFVTIVQFLMEGFVPSLYDSLGIYIPLIVVNCIILGRAESYASKNPVLPSIFDGIGMGLGFTVGLTAIGIVERTNRCRNRFFDIQCHAGILRADYNFYPWHREHSLFLHVLTAFQNKVKKIWQSKGNRRHAKTVGCGCRLCKTVRKCFTAVDRYRQAGKNE